MEIKKTKIEKDFGTFYVRDFVGARIDIYDSRDEWLAHLDYDYNEDYKNSILHFIDNVKTLEGLLYYFEVEYYDIVEGFDNAVKYAYENGYLNEGDSPETLYNECVGFIGDSVIFLMEF